MTISSNGLCIGFRDCSFLGSEVVEALIHRHLPINGLLGVVCYTDNMRRAIERQLQARNLDLPVHTRTGWYF